MNTAQLAKLDGLVRCERCGIDASADYLRSLAKAGFVAGEAWCQTGGCGGTLSDFAPTPSGEGKTVVGFQRGRKSRSRLPSAAPEVGAPRDELAQWLTVALALGENPVASVARYGRHVDARMVLVLRDGQRVTFERAADAFEANKLIQLVMLATGAQLPAYGREEALQIAGAMVRLSELLAEDDARGEAIEWGRSFLHGAKVNTIEVSDFASPRGRWEALCILSEWKPPAELPPFATATERAVLVAESATGARIVRTSDFAAHARACAGRPLSWAGLHGRMVEVGWEHRGELQQRQPNGQGKRKAHVYVVPAEWENE